MRLPLFVLRHLIQFPHPSFFRSQDILNSEKNYQQLTPAAAMGKICLVFNFTHKSVTGGNLWKPKA
jgi:hypothetical protein